MRNTDTQKMCGRDTVRRGENEGLREIEKVRKVVCVRNRERLRKGMWVKQRD